jgi:glycosyltransferase involved in cell wall biosynthesis
MTALPVRRCLLVSTAYADAAPRGKLRALAALGVEVTVAIPQHWPDPVYGRMRQATWERHGAVELFPVPVDGFDADTARFRRRELVTLIRDKRPDLVQIEETPGGTLATQVARAARRARIPVVACSAVNVRWPGGWITGRRRRSTLRAARGGLAGSVAAGRLLIRVRGDLPVEVVPAHGVPVPSAPVHQPHRGVHLGFVGRLERRRGLDTLLDALSARRMHDWTLTVVGDGPDRERLEALAARLRLAARIRWAGALPAEHVLALWPHMDVLVHPAHRLPDWEEPYGDLIAEAMGHEVAVVGTAAGVVPETIGEAGIVVAPDDATALAEALARVSDPVEQRALAAAARARALTLFTDDAIAERTITFWRRVLT